MYKFVKEGTDEVVEVDFELMMTKDVAGFITLEDGTRARQIDRFETKRASVDTSNANGKPQPSDNLGCFDYDLPMFEEDRIRHGHIGIEFKPDPTFPQFYQVHFASHAARDAYLAHRCKVDQNKTVASPLSERDIADAEEYVKNRWK